MVGNLHFGTAQSNTPTSTPATTASGGNGTLELTMTLDKTSLSLGESVNLTLTLTNISKQTVSFTHTGLDFDFKVYNGTNNLVYQYSNFLIIPDFTYIVPLPPGEGFSANFTWMQTCNFNEQVTGNPVSPGTYNIVGETGSTYGIQTTPIQLTIVGAPTATPTPTLTLTPSATAPSATAPPTPEFPSVIIIIVTLMAVTVAILFNIKKQSNKS